MTDTFRKAYRELTDAEHEHIEQIKYAAHALELLIDCEPSSREQARQIDLAITNLEQAVMWATKAYT
jgi:hypothetical protein